MKWDYYAKNGVSKVPWSQNEAFFRNKRLKFWPIFPYILGENRAKVRVGANFDAPRLGNRLELRKK